jgi:lipopolysaccharide assembly outer membrane protein LptD (OstA)
MKAALLVVLVFGLTVFAGAQTAAPTFELKWGTMANDIQVADSVTHLRGGVELKLGTIRITADEADMNTTTGEVDLRGNVHLSTK